MNTSDDSLMLTLELPTYHKWHAVLQTDLLDRDKVYDRNTVGITLDDADKIAAVTGCRRLEEYLVRMALNDQVFAELLKKCIG